MGYTHRDDKPCFGQKVTVDMTLIEFTSKETDRPEKGSVEMGENLRSGLRTFHGKIGLPA